MLLTPAGNEAKDIEKLLLFAMWGKHLEKESSDKPVLINAHMGRPSYPLNKDVIDAELDYWQSLSDQAQKIHQLIEQDKNFFEHSDEIVNNQAVVNYGHPLGDHTARVKIAKALTRWYQDKVPLDESHILFTVGGSLGLTAIFEMLNSKHPNGLIITTFPHYCLYNGPYGKNKLFPIPVMQEKGYLLTAKLLDESLQKALATAKTKRCNVSALLLCDPHNPLGTTIEQQELFKIAEVLRQYPDLTIVVDEAYAEMRLYDQNYLPLLSVAPDLSNRMIILRSGTKALSAAGERMGVVICPNNKLLEDILQKIINIQVHAPRSSQNAFACALEKLTSKELANFNQFYRVQVEYVSERLKAMGAALPDENYHVTGTFYVCANFSDLLGLELPKETKQALNKIGKICSDEDIAYYLLFQDRVLITPLSYFEAPKQMGYLRITCSGGKSELKSLLDRLENRLMIARKIKRELLSSQIQMILNKIKNRNLDSNVQEGVNNLEKNYLSHMKCSLTSLSLKMINRELNGILLEAQKLLRNLFPEQHFAASKIQFSWRALQEKKKAQQLMLKEDKEWTSFVNKMALPSSEIHRFFSSLPRSQRSNFFPWKQHLEENFEKNINDNRSENNYTQSL